MLKPWNGLRCWPLIAPSTSRRERRVRSEICAITSGSEYFRDGSIGGSLPDRDVFQQPRDDRVAGLAGGLRVVVDDEAVAQHGQGHGPDILDGDAGPAGQGGP